MDTTIKCVVVLSLCMLPAIANSQFFGLYKDDVLADSVIETSVALSGNLTSIQKAEDEEKVLPEGSIGLRWRTNDWMFSIRFNVISTLDTLKADHGKFLLTPGIGAGFNSLLCHFMYNLDRDWPTNVLFYLGFSETVWADEEAASSEHAISFGTGVSVCQKWSSVSASGDHWSACCVDLGVNYRTIQGDMRGNVTFLKELVNTEITYSFGGELGVKVAYDGITAGFRYYFFPGWSGWGFNKIKGFANGQIVASIGISGDFTSFQSQRPF